MSRVAVYERTAAAWRGLPVTLVGYAGGPLLAIAACGTPQQIAIGVVLQDADEDLERVAAAAAAQAEDDDRRAGR